MWKKEVLKKAAVLLRNEPALVGIYGSISVQVL